MQEHYEIDAFDVKKTVTKFWNVGYDRFQNSFSSLSYCQMAFRKRALLNQQIMEKQRLQVKKWIGRIKEERMSNV